VLEIAGFAEMIAQANGSAATSAAPAADWSRAESIVGDCGLLRILPGSTEPGYIEIAGDIMDVLASRVTPAHVFSKKFSEKAYSIGLGALGDRREDYFNL